MDKIKAVLLQDKIFSNSKEAMELFEKSGFGEREKEKVVYMFEEALYLVEEGKMQVLSSNYKEITEEELIKKIAKKNKRILMCYSVFKNLRKKGFIVKSGLKFGSDYRVYEKGKKVGKSHSKWICYCTNENQKLEIKEFTSKGRVANSTKKKLMLGIVDAENSVSYYECGWLKVV